MAIGAWHYVLLLYGVIITVAKGQKYEYMNCYYDLYNARILKDLTDCSDTPLCDCSIDQPYCVTNVMTIDFCENICRRKNYKYFGLQAGDQCFCGGGFSNTGEWYPADTPSAAERCRTSCNGDSTQECGGDYLMRVFRFTDPLANSACFHPGSPGEPTTVSANTFPDYFFDIGETIRYSCINRGDRLIGVSEIVCHDTGQWTSTPPNGCQCCAAICPDPSIPHNAFQSSGPKPDVYYEGDILAFYCRTDFSMVTIRCIYTGMWTELGNPCTDPATHSSTTRRTPNQPTTTKKSPTINEPTPPQRVCVPITCIKNCPYGLQVDVYGCTICQCSHPYPPNLQTTVMTSQMKEIQSGTTVESQHNHTTEMYQDTVTPVQGTKASITVKPPQQSKSFDPKPLVIGGVAVLVFIIIVAIVINCTKCLRQSNPARKEPIPPPTDYPTLNNDKRGPHRKDSVYDVIKEPKRKKRKNSYVQNPVPNDLPNAPQPPTVSNRVSQQTFTNSHSLNRSLDGRASHAHSNLSLSRSEAGGNHPNNTHSRSVTRGSTAKAHRHTPNSQNRNRSMVGGSQTPSSRSLSRSISSEPRYPSSHTHFHDSSMAGVYETPDNLSLNRSVGGGSHNASFHSPNRSMASEPHNPSLNGALATGPRAPFIRTQSMYINLPPKPTGDLQRAYGSQDRINRNASQAAQNSTYMSSINRNSTDKPRPPRRAQSTEISSVPGQIQQRVSKSSTTSQRRRDPGLRIDTQLSSHSSGYLPDSPFGDDAKELTTHL